jgi:phosphate transport system substrate-binding protein
VTYHLPSAPHLRLDGPTVAGLFLGRILKWNDPRIATLNPGIQLPNQDVIVVHRSDGSGTTYIFTDYLCGVSPDWQRQAGRGTAVNWPAGLGAKGNEGVAGQIKQLEGSVGYVELAYAHENQLPVASIQNPAGEFVSPSLESVTRALASAQIPDDFRFSMVNAPGRDAYPIAGATWLLVYERQRDPVKGGKLVEFLKWAITQGESMAPSLDYAPLPESLRQRVLQTIQQIRY